MVMVDWVSELYATGALMDAADPKHGGQYVEAEMERVLKLGLLCANPQPEGRVGMGQALQVLEEAAPIPSFDSSFYLDISAPNTTLKSPPPYYSGSTAAFTSNSPHGR